MERDEVVKLLPLNLKLDGAGADVEPSLARAHLSVVRFLILPTQVYSATWLNEGA